MLSTRSSFRPFLPRSRRRSFATVFLPAVPASSSPSRTSRTLLKVGVSLNIGRRKSSSKFFSRYLPTPIASIENDCFAASPHTHEDDGSPGGKVSIFSSSECEESDTELLISPSVDLDLPVAQDRLDTPESALTVTAHQIATVHARGRRKRGKFLVPLPSPFGLVCFGKFYLVVTAFCLVSMGNGVNLTDGLDGLAGGTAALALLGMCIAVLPICPDLAVFGASMAGACVGFLCHNRYKASIFMGDTGSLALGGALAAMAACTGMFLPLFVSSGIFVLETLSVIIQVFYFKSSKCFARSGRRLFRMAPFHHHLELCGFKEPVIVASAYILSCLLSLSAAYIGLVSA